MIKEIVSIMISAATVVSFIPQVPAKAEEIERYPYTIFASSYDEGAITIDADTICVNGNIVANGAVDANGNMCINGSLMDEADESMLFIFDKIDKKYFSSSNVKEHEQDYDLNETNININIPTYVQGETTLTGNVNINTALKSLENINLYGEVKNTNNSVIFSKYGDIVIESQNINLNGFVYAPFGSVTISAQNLNLNNTVIIAENIVLDCSNLNVNNNDAVSSFVGTTSDLLDIPYDEWKYMKDENSNDFPDFFEDTDNWKLLKDTDGEGLPNCIEVAVNSDPNVTDTDSDGLDDYYEVTVTFTSPSVNDSDNDLITDDKEDFDNDNLNNFQEYLLNTSPWNDDSDEDTLNDGAEVNTYNTNPLESDTDHDGLSDADELILNVLPDDPDTNSDGILDGDEYYPGTVTKDLTTNDPKVAAITGVSVELNCSGIAEKCVSIENTYNIDMMSSDVVGIVGVPVDIKSSVDFETAKITFSYDETLLNETSEEDLVILWYDRENNQYVPLEETIVDTVNNTVSYTTTHFSTYLVIDKKIWLDTWREEISYNKLPGVVDVAYNIGFVVDVSGSMSGTRLEKAKTALKTFIDAMYECDEATLVTFNSNAKVVKKFGTSKFELKAAVNNLTATGGTSTNAGLKAAINEMQDHLSSTEKNIIILICDGDVDNDNETKKIIKTAQDKDKPINIYTLNVVGGNSEVLESIANLTGGYSYKAKTSDEIESEMKKLQNNTIYSVDTTDSDGDGIYDTYEINGVRIQNGKVIKTDPNNADTDGDGISDGIEIGLIAAAKEMTFFNKKYSCVLCNPNSDPLSSDYDGDGFADDVDPDPFTYIKIKDFGSDSYISDIQNKASIGNPFDNSGLDPFWNYIAYSLIEKGSKAYVAHQAIDLMMQDVNTYEDYTFAVSDENWLKFCEFFNECVMDYGSITKEIHYFRLKLNRTPDSFKELVDNKDNWYLYDKKHTRYHMNNNNNDINNVTKYISSNSHYPSYSTYWNEYNMKFVDKYGMNEVVVTPNKDLSGMSDDEIYDYLKDATNWQILTDDYDKAQSNPNFKYDPVNVGTYNYSAFDFDYINLDGTKKKTSSSKHNKYDVYPYLGGKKSDYKNWGNVPGMIYGNSIDQRDKNEDYYYDNANTKVFSDYWNKGDKFRCK